MVGVQLQQLNLDSGAISTGFGNINNGSSSYNNWKYENNAAEAVCTLNGDTASGDVAVGYTAEEGIIITGQGSTNDVTIKNDADADVLTVAAELQMLML